MTSGGYIVTNELLDPPLTMEIDDGVSVYISILCREIMKKVRMPIVLKKRGLAIAKRVLVVRRS